LGTHGRGILEEAGLEGRCPVVVSTFSKVFGGIGGIVLGDRDVVDHVKHRARSFLFSASLPVPIVAAASTILDMLEAEGPALVAELHDKAAYFRKRLLEIGFDLGKSNTHIMPVMCRDERKALFMHVAHITRGHTREDMDMALDLLATYGEAFFVLSGEEIGPMEL
jgi:glycine C-acetyltransferase